MANDANKVVYENIVYKKGEGFMSKWKERYLILYIDKRLSYFIVDGLEYKGAILVDNIQPSKVQKSAKIHKSDGANYGFSILTANRKWEFAVKASLERDQWITKIRQVIQGEAGLIQLNKSQTVDFTHESLAVYSPLNGADKSHPKKKITHNRNASKSVGLKQHFKQRSQPMNISHTRQAQPPNAANFGYRQYSLNAKPANVSYHLSYDIDQDEATEKQAKYNNKHNIAAQSLEQQKKQNHKKLQRKKSERANMKKMPLKRENSGYRNYKQNSRQMRFKTANKRMVAKSVYSNFKVNKYDRNTDICHLFGGYIRGCCLDEQFPLILQHICQQYAGYVLIGSDLKQFPETTLLADNTLKSSMLELLCNATNKYIINKIELIYRGSRDGMNAKSFHHHCDGHSQTLTVLYSNYGHLFGGYTNIAWSCDRKYHRDDDAFLFVLNTQNNKAATFTPQIFRIKPGQEANAVLHYRDFGPVFGYGHDLAVFSLSEKVDTQSCCWSYAFSSIQLIGAWMYCKVTECEVFQIFTDS